jgi:hypothetical protein
MVQALESDSHVSHLVWLNKSLDVPPIPNLRGKLCATHSQLRRAASDAAVLSGRVTTGMFIV